MSEAAAATTAQETPKAAGTTILTESTGDEAANAQTETKPEGEEKTETTETKQGGEEEAPSEGDAPKEAAKSGPPEKYELQVPKDAFLSEADVEKIESFARDHGFSNEVAQKLLERDNERLGEFQKFQEEELKAQADEWKSQLEKDKEFGGDNLGENAELAKRFLKKYGSDDLVEALEVSGLGNHPGLFKMLARAGRELAEDTLLKPDGKAAAKKVPVETKLYGNTKLS